MNTPLCNTSIHIIVYPFDPGITATIANKQQKNQNIKYKFIIQRKQGSMHCNFTTVTYHILPTSSNTSVKMSLIV